MEKRLILAIALSFLVLIGYQLIFMKKKPQPEVPPQEAGELAKTPAAEVQPQEQPTAEQAKPAAPEAEKKMQESISSPGEERVTVDTPLYRAVWSNRGGVLESWKLKEYKDYQKEEQELVSPAYQEIGKGPFSIWTEDPELDGRINSAYYKVSWASATLSEGQTGEVRFVYADGLGTEVEKIFTFEGGKYDFGVKINIQKNGQKILPRILWGPSIGSVSALEQNRRVAGGGRGIAVFVPKNVYRIDERRFKPEQQSAFNFVSWAAYENNYFAALFLTAPQKGTATFLRELKDNIPYYFLSVSEPERVLMGPKEFDTLRRFAPGAKKLINFGFFGAIAEILLRTIKIIHKAIPNWGVGIILLTLIIKIIFFPLTYSSTRSISRMQELQPKIKALRAKYKKVKQDIAQRRQMNEEMMKLYKEHGINPASGCLPLLIQIPVFFGFFRLLSVAIEFRQSPFLLWIKDLSIKDPYYITPILMGATQFISQKMTPTSADPSQARMMLIMPVVFTIFFMNFQSGLVLYWLTNNVLQIGQQYLMNRLMKKQKRESHGKDGKRNKP
jgi:YidC/Oxa1 family membrane protein insertase